MSSDLGDSLYINLPVIGEEWIEAHEVEFWCGGVAEFRQIKPCSWGDAFEKHFSGLMQERPLRWQAVSEMCEGLVAGRVQEIVSGVFRSAELWGVSIASADEIETYNKAVSDAFHSVASAIADEWASHFGIEL